jgi:hypothetical protein
VVNVDDPMKAWWDMIEQFQKAGLGSNAPEVLARRRVRISGAFTEAV